MLSPSTGSKLFENASLSLASILAADFLRQFVDHPQPLFLPLPPETLLDLSSEQLAEVAAQTKLVISGPLSDQGYLKRAFQSSSSGVAAPCQSNTLQRRSTPLFVLVCLACLH